MSDSAFDEGLEEICVYCRHAKHGQLLAVLESNNQLKLVEEALKEKSGKGVRSIRLPSRTSANKLVTALSDKLSEAPLGSVVLVSGWSDAYPEGDTLRKAFAQTNLYRERLFGRNLVQVWLMNGAYAEALAAHAPDTYSWFNNVIHLSAKGKQGMPSAARFTSPNIEERVVERSPLEARRTSDWLTSRALEILATNSSEAFPLGAKHWAEAVSALSNAGLLDEAQEKLQAFEQWCHEAKGSRDYIGNLAASGRNKFSDKSVIASALIMWGQTLANLGEMGGPPEFLKEAIRAYNGALEFCTREDFPSQWAAIQNNLGCVLQVLGGRSGSEEALRDSITAHQNALQVLTKEAEPIRWARFQSNLGAALQVLGERSNANEQLLESVSAFRRALEVRTKDSLPIEWARTQTNLGNVLQTIGQRFGSDVALWESVSAYVGALEVYNKHSSPSNWAQTQRNLGSVLGILGERSGSVELMQDSLSANLQALEYYTVDSFPLEWAGTYNNLGNVYHILGEMSDSTEKLVESVDAFRRALSVFSVEESPVAWSMTQHNLGNVLRAFGGRTGSVDLLLESINAYGNALRLRSKESAPAQWAETQNSLGTALQILAKERSDAQIALDSLDAAVSAADWFITSSDPRSEVAFQGVVASLKLCRDLGADLPPEMQELLNTIEAEEAASDNPSPDAP